MAYVTDKDFRKLAEAVTDDLMQRSVPLNESIAKLASEMEMTEEQTRRLCEAANNATFNKMFKARESDKTASDRLIEFDVADYKKVLGHQIKEAEQAVTVEKTASLYEMRALEDERYVDDSMTTKVAFELRPETVARPEVTVRTARKVAEHLAHEKIAAEMEYYDTLSALKNSFKRIYNNTSFSQFEKAAAVAYGPVAEVHLNELRRSMRLPEVTYNLDVLNKTAGYVDDTTAEMQLFGSLVKTAERAAKIVKGLKKLENVV